MRIHGTGCVLGLVLTFGTASVQAVAQVVPQVAAKAAGEAIEVRGEGVQVYACRQSADGFAWRLTGPEATLLDPAGVKVGTHFAGPSWQANDGSTVVGEALASGRAPDAGSVPWLVLRAKSHSGAGRFASTAFIVRLRTKGGAAPLAGCDQKDVGATSRVAYSATYVLFPDSSRQP